MRRTGLVVRAPRLGARFHFLALVCLTGLLAAGAARSAPPDEGDCPEVRPHPIGSEKPIDTAPIVLEEGMVLVEEDLLLLRGLLPQEIWLHREAFFHEGMRLKIGPCHRRYPTGDAYVAATDANVGSARLDKNGNLEDYRAGLPFPPDKIDPKAEDAALHWAWNYAKRYVAAGPRGDFRFTDIPASLGGTQVFRGNYFWLRTAGRADLAGNDYAVEDGDEMLFASGGSFVEPFDARHLAWRQFRPTKADRRYEESDDIFVYVPTMRKTRRAASVWVDGIYLPKVMLSGDSGGGAVPFGSELGGAINPTAGQSIAVTQAMRRGSTGLTLRPNAYLWRMKGSTEVLAPMNGNVPGWPIDPERTYGPSGLSVATDRWDVRQAVVIEGALRERNETLRTLTLYIDEQSQQLLYWISRTDKRRLLDIGMFVHRFSDDVADYPKWADSSAAHVFDPVASVFFNALEGRGGWRREAYGTRSHSPSSGEQRSFLSSDSLNRGR